MRLLPAAVLYPPTMGRGRGSKSHGVVPVVITDNLVNDVKFDTYYLLYQILEVLNISEVLKRIAVSKRCLVYSYWYNR